MRLLYVTPRLPYPPERGDTVRSWGVLRALAARGGGHEVWLASLHDCVPDPAHLKVLREDCREVAAFARPRTVRLLRTVLTAMHGGSATHAYFNDPRLRRTVARWTQEHHFDALLTYSSALADVATAANVPRRVLDLGDVDSAKWRLFAGRSWPPLSWLYSREATHVRELEARCCETHDLVLLVNERERRKLLRHQPGADTGVLPNLLNLADYADFPAAPPAEPVVGIVGSMSYGPNIRAVNWFGTHVWPRVRDRVPAARWLIVGREPSPQVRRFAAQRGVSVTGYVPDVRPYLAQIRAYAAAVDGDLGVQSKLLIAMAAGRACVVTPESAAGIEHEDPPPFLIADSAAAFADGVVRILRDDAVARALARRAQATVADRYDAEENGRRLENWLRGAAAQRGGRKTSVRTDTAEPCPAATACAAAEAPATWGMSGSEQGAP